jgi:hypothetical protein
MLFSDYYNVLMRVFLNELVAWNVWGTEFIQSIQRIATSVPWLLLACFCSAWLVAALRSAELGQKINARFQFSVGRSNSPLSSAEAKEFVELYFRLHGVVPS